MVVIKCILSLGLAYLLISVQSKFLSFESFEHDTQAATGQTTGVWVVRFCSRSTPACTEFDNTWNELKEEMLEQQLFLADVDVDASPQLAERFDIQEVPAWAMFRRQRMFILSGRQIDSKDLTSWIVDKWSQTEGIEVPPERSAWWSNAVAYIWTAILGGDVQKVALIALPVLGVCLALFLLMLAREALLGGERAKRD